MKITKKKNQKLKELSHFKGEKGMLVEEIKIATPEDKMEEKFKEFKKYSLRNFIKTPKEPTSKDKEQKERELENKKRRIKLRENFSKCEVYLEKDGNIKLEILKKLENINIESKDIKGNFSDEEKNKIVEVFNNILENKDIENIDLSVLKNKLEINQNKLLKIKKSLEENKVEFINEAPQRKRAFIYEYYSDLEKSGKYLKNIEDSFKKLYSEEDIRELKEAFNEKKIIKNSVYECYHKILEKNLSKISEEDEIKKSVEKKNLSFEHIKDLKLLTKSQLVYKYLLKNGEKEEIIKETFAHLVEMEMKYILKSLLSLNEKFRVSRIENIFTYEKLNNLIQNRLKNKLLDYVGRKGKVKEYNIGKSTTYELNKIRKNESELRGFSAAIASASFSYRNILDKNYQKDILLLKDIDLENKLKETLDIDLFGKFFPTFDGSNDKIKKFMKELKEYIKNLRNNTLHFKSNEKLVNLLKESAKEFKEVNNLGLKEFDREYLKIFILEKYNSAGVFDYLNDTLSKKFFNKVEIRLENNAPKLSPSFDKIYSKFKDFNVLLKLKFNEKEKLEERIAYKFLLSEIYYNQFLDYFINDKKNIFQNALNNVFESNKKAYLSKETGHSKLDKFEKNIKYKNPVQYLAELHSYYSKNQEILKNDKDENEILIFIRKIFTKGFFDFLNMEKYEDILKLKFNQRKEIISKEILKLKNGEKSIVLEELLNSIEIENLKELKEFEKAFYCFLRLIDSKEKSNLKGFLEKTEVLSENADIKRLKRILTLVTLVNSKSSSNSSDLNIFKKLTEFKGESINDLYEFGKNGNEIDSMYCDRQNIKEFKAIHNLKKYATLQVIENLVQKTNYKVTSQEIKKYYELKMDIEKVVKDQEEQHRYYETSKLKKFEIDKYKKAVEKISEYTKLKNKIEFNDLNLVQSLLLRILYRTAGYVSMWERDLKFKLLTLKKENEPIEEIFDYRKNKAYGKGQICPKYDRFLERNENLKDILPKNIIFEKKSRKGEGIYLRNYIAHFNYIPNSEYSLKDIFEKMRELLDYDRKLKNSYLKSIKDIFKEYNFEIEIDINKDKKIEIKDVKSLKTVHLKKFKKRIEIEKHSKKLCNLIRAMIEYKGN